MTWQILVTVSIVTGQVYLHVRIMGYKRCYVITDYGVNNMTNKIAYQSSQSATEEDIASLIIAIVLVAIFYIVRYGIFYFSCCLFFKRQSQPNKV